MAFFQSHRSDAARVKKKFSSFFKSLVIELDKDLYGPDNHLVEVRINVNTSNIDPAFNEHKVGNTLFSGNIISYPTKNIPASKLYCLSNAVLLLGSL